LFAKAATTPKQARRPQRHSLDILGPVARATMAVRTASFASGLFVIAGMLLFVAGTLFRGRIFFGGGIDRGLAVHLRLLLAVRSLFLTAAASCSSGRSKCMQSA
jgi:hypothetical protein